MSETLSENKTDLESPTLGKSGFSIADILNSKTLNLQETLKNLSKDLTIATSGPELSWGKNFPISPISSIPVSGTPTSASKNQFPGVPGLHNNPALSGLHPLLALPQAEVLLQQSGLLKGLSGHAGSPGVGLPPVSGPASVSGLTPTALGGQFVQPADIQLNESAAAALLRWYSPWALLSGQNGMMPQNSSPIIQQHFANNLQQLTNNFAQKHANGEFLQAAIFILKIPMLFFLTSVK